MDILLISWAEFEFLLQKCTAYIEHGWKTVSEGYPVMEKFGNYCENDVWEVCPLTFMNPKGQLMCVVIHIGKWLKDGGHK